MSKNIKIDTKESFSIKACLFLLCLLLPTHWFWHWDPSWSFWDGLQREPWIPKVYVSMLFGVLLWAISIFSDFFTDTPRGRATLRPHFRHFFSRIGKLSFKWWIILPFIVASNVAFSLEPSATLSFWLQTLAGPGLLLAWIWRYKKWVSASIFWSGVLGGISIQAFLAWWQYIFQTSLGGYWLLGQPDFTSIFLAKSQLSPLVVTLPYGSTPHPNVLAGWLVLGIILILNARLWVSQNIIRLKMWQFIGVVFLIVPLAWTESWSAWLTLIILMLLPGWRNIWKKSPVKAWILVGAMWCMLSFGLVFLSQISPKLLDNPSWRHRVTFLHAAPRLFLERPHGWGLVQHPLGYSPLERQALRNLATQPIHSAGIGLAVDLGFWTLLLLFTFLIIEHRKYSIFLGAFTLSLPIFNLDHYGYSTMSGQYLIILFLVFLNLNFQINRPVILREADLNSRKNEEKNNLSQSE